MRLIPGQLITQLGAETYASATLYTLGSLKFTDWDVSIFVSGYLYQSRSCTPGPISYGTGNLIDSFTCDFDDTNQAIYNSFGAVGPSVETALTVALVALDTTNLVPIQGAYTKIFDGFFSEWEYTPQKFSIKAISKLDRLRHPTNRISSSSCLVKKFKDQYCGYTGGGTTCDRTYGSCYNYNNDLNFRGFRWLPSLVNKQIRFST